MTTHPYLRLRIGSEVPTTSYDASHGYEQGDVIIYSGVCYTAVNVTNGAAVWNPGGSFDLAAAIHAATNETVMNEDDEMGFWQAAGAALRRISWSTMVDSLSLWLGAYFSSHIHTHEGVDDALVPHSNLSGLTTGDPHTQYVKHGLATAVNDFLVASGAGAFVKKTLAETITILRTVLDGVYSAFSYSAISVTTANVSAAEGITYDCTIAGLTANRDFNLPTPSAAGKEISLRIRDGDDTFALIVKANGVEITRLFIAGEYLKLRSYGTGAGNWQIETDGRKACIGSASRSTAQTITDSTATKILLNTTDVDVGDIVDSTTNRRINIRRAGNYTITGFGSILNLDDQEQISVRVFKNGAELFRSVIFISAATANQTGRLQIGPKLVALAAADFIELYVFHNEGANQNTDTSPSEPWLAVEEKL